MPMLNFEEKIACSSITINTLDKFRLPIDNPSIKFANIKTAILY